MLFAAFLNVRAFIKANPRVVIALGAALLVITLLLFVYLKGRDDAKRQTEAAYAVAVAEAVKTDARAKELTGAARQQHAVDNAVLKKELTDAVAEVPDDVPDAVAVQLGCQRLRNAGTSVADLSACR